MVSAKNPMVIPCKIIRARINLLPYRMFASPPLPITIRPIVKAAAVKTIATNIQIKNISLIGSRINESEDFYSAIFCARQIKNNSHQYLFSTMKND
jgi:hypothetical protein